MAKMAVRILLSVCYRFLVSNRFFQKTGATGPTGRPLSHLSRPGPLPRRPASSGSLLYRWPLPLPVALWASKGVVGFLAFLIGN